MCRAVPQYGDCDCEIRRRYLERQIAEVRKRVTKAEAPPKKKKGAAAGEPPPAKVRRRPPPISPADCLSARRRAGVDTSPRTPADSRQCVSCVCSPSARTSCADNILQVCNLQDVSQAANPAENGSLSPHQTLLRSCSCESAKVSKNPHQPPQGTNLTPLTSALYAHPHWPGL